MSKRKQYCLRNRVTGAVAPVPYFSDLPSADESCRKMNEMGKRLAEADHGQWPTYVVESVL